MLAQHITSKSCIQGFNKKISVISKEITTGNRISFKNSSDIIIGGINSVNHLLYKSSTPGLQSAISILNSAQSSLELMSDITQELHRTFVAASTQNLPQNELNVLETLFQNQIQMLDQVANSAKYASISLLDGSIDPATPLALHTPSGGVINITAPNMTNAASPIANPDSAPHIKIRSDAATFAAAVPGINTLDEIKAFCGEDSFLWIVANQIDLAFAAGLATPGNEYRTCLAQLQGLNWDALFPTKPADAAAARALIAEPDFSMTPGGNTIEACFGAGGGDPHFMLWTAIIEAIGAVPNPYIPAKYVAQTSAVLSISSPDYFEAVEQRIKSAQGYIIGAQISINAQIKALEGVKTQYFEYMDQFGETADKYLKVDVLQASGNLNQLISSLTLAIEATVVFQARLNKILSDTANNLLQRG